jgi:biotin-(acetyl-CoA carboxylase) ligase
VNLNLDTATLATINQPATSLSNVLGHAVDVAEFRDALAMEFLAAYRPFLETGFSLIRDEYLKRFLFIGEEVEIRSPTATLRGRVETVSLNGELELITSTGERQTVTLGEIFQTANPR